MENTTYPEINALGLADTKEALKLAMLNYDSLTDAGKRELDQRIKALSIHLADLERCAQEDRDSADRADRYYSRIYGY